MRIGAFFITLALLVQVGCAHGTSALYGTYAAYGTGGDVVKPPVTLEIAQSHRYRFCQAGRCVAGKWSLPSPSAGDGQITFQGPELESYVIALSIDRFGPDEVYEQRGKLGFIDLSYTVGMLGAEIMLGAGDAAFVKQ